MTSRELLLNTLKGEKTERTVDLVYDRFLFR